MNTKPPFNHARNASVNKTPPPVAPAATSTSLGIHPVQRETTTPTAFSTDPCGRRPRSASPLRENVTGGGRPTPIRTAPALPSAAMNHDRSEPIMHPPACPACGQPATQATVRDLSDTEHEGLYCDGEHIWTVKWFAKAAG